MKINELLTDASKWTKGRYARNVYGNACEVSSPAATQWCLLGALRKCYPNDISTPVQIKLRAAIRKRRPDSFGGITLYNDNHYTTFKEIKELINELDI